MRAGCCGCDGVPGWLQLQQHTCSLRRTHNLAQVWSTLTRFYAVRCTFLCVIITKHTQMQCYSSSDQGKALGGQYHLEQMPACIIVDPITRAKLWERYGFVGPEALVEELVPYLDCGGW